MIPEIFIAKHVQKKVCFFFKVMFYPLFLLKAKLNGQNISS